MIAARALAVGWGLAVLVTLIRGSPAAPSSPPLVVAEPPLLAGGRLDVAQILAQGATPDSAEAWARHLVRFARPQAIDPAVLARQVLAESGGRQFAVGPLTPDGYAVGLAQIMASRWRGAFPDCDVFGRDLFDARVNLCYQARILGGYLRTSGGSLRLALRRYLGCRRCTHHEDYADRVEGLDG